MATARACLDYGAKGDDEAKLTSVFIADAIADLGGKLWGREAEWGCAPTALDATREFVAAWRNPAVLADLAFTDVLPTVPGDVDIADNAALRLDVANREARTKPGSGRLQNDGLLASWTGGFSGRTTFRWPQVTRRSRCFSVVLKSLVPA